MANSTLPAHNPSEPCKFRTLLVTALVIALVATGYAGWTAWTLRAGQNYGLDQDGWGLLVQRQQIEGRSLQALFTAPSIWKGPVVPFVFGLVYYVVPTAESILGFNALAFGLASGMFFIGFSQLGAGRGVAVLAVVGWLLYIPARGVFGFYFAEPFLGLLVATIFLSVVSAVQRQSIGLTLLAGVLSGLLLLSRAPFFLAICGLPLLLAYQSPQRRVRMFSAFMVGLMAIFSPWVIRNWVTYGELIPFTTEGGKIVFQGTYINGDDLEQNSIRKIPEYVAIEQGELGKTPIEQYHYWRGLALEQFRNDIPGQLRLCLRKAIRFWAYMPQGSWIPAWKTGLVAMVCLPLAFYGVIIGWRSLLVQLCALWVGGLWAFHALVHCELRYNFPILPMAFLLALLGIGQLLIRSRLPLPRALQAFAAGCEI